MIYGSNDIKKRLYEVANLFDRKAKETIIFENFGKHILEINFILKNLKYNGRILDIGGGLGINLMCLRKLIGQTVELCLIDQFEEYTDDNRMGSSDIGLELMRDSKISLINQDFWKYPKLPYDSDHFDIITCFDVIEHLPSHPLKLFGEIKRVLKTNGVFIFGAPNAISLHRRFKLLLGIHPYMPFDAWCGEKYFQHYREYTPNEFRCLLDMSGFNHLETILSDEPSATRAYNNYHNGKHNKLSFIAVVLYIYFFLEKLLPRMRQSVYCIARKFV